MKETAMDVNERKIRNGIRKQAEKIWREKQKVWDKLKDTGPKKWTAEDAEILNQHGIDVEQELADILTAEIEAERDIAWEEKVKQNLKDFLEAEYRKTNE